MLKKPKFDITKLNEMYSEAHRADDRPAHKGAAGAAVGEDGDKEAENLL